MPEPRSKQHLRIKQFYGTSENAVKRVLLAAVALFGYATIEASIWPPIAR